MGDSEAMVNRGGRGCNGVEEFRVQTVWSHQVRQLATRGGGAQNIKSHDFRSGIQKEADQVKMVSQTGWSEVVRVPLHPK